MSSALWGEEPSKTATSVAKPGTRFAARPKAKLTTSMPSRPARVPSGRSEEISEADDSSRLALDAAEILRHRRKST